MTNRSDDRISVPRHSVKDGFRDLDRGGIKSARRVMEIFELLEQVNRPLTVSDIVRLTEIPQASASGLLKTLRELGYLCWNPDDRTYQPSLRLNMLGGWVHDQIMPHSNLRLAMQELARRTSLSVVLGQRTGKYVQYAHVAFRSSEREDDVPIGVVRTLTSTALGYPLLASMSDCEAKRIATACLADPHCRSSNIDLNEVMSNIAKVRRLGYAYSVRLQNTNKASFSFKLGFKDDTHTESTQLALAIAGKRRDVEKQLPSLIEQIHTVKATYLPDVKIELCASLPIQKI